MPQVSINSNNSSTDCKKTATGNGNLQPETEINEYSSSKKLLELFTTRVVLEYSSTRGSPKINSSTLFFFKLSSSQFVNGRTYGLREVIK